MWWVVVVIVVVSAGHPPFVLVVEFDHPCTHATVESITDINAPVEQHPFRGVDAEVHEALGVQQGQLHHLPQLLQGLLGAADLCDDGYGGRKVG